MQKYEHSDYAINNLIRKINGKNLKKLVLVQGESHGIRCEKLDRVM